jgi:hypothetical protein
MIEVNKNILREGLRDLRKSQEAFVGYNFKLAYDCLFAGYNKISRVATLEKMNEIE